MDHDQLMPIEESYAERRQLFKDIWLTAINMDKKDSDILNKPKVIKTLRLTQVDRSTGKAKKQKIKNLRSVCKKILEFCDKQDADDIFYRQIAAEGHVSPLHKPEVHVLQLHKPEPHTKRRKRSGRKKIKKSKSLYTPSKKAGDPRKTTSGRKDNFAIDSKITPSRQSTSPIKYTHQVVKRPDILTTFSSTAPSLGKPLRKVIKKKKKKPVKSNISRG